jgi:hypothetical protein
MAEVDLAVGVVVVGAEPDVCGQHDLFRIATDIGAMCRQHIALAGELLC